MPRREKAALRSLTLMCVSHAADRPQKQLGLGRKPQADMAGPSTPAEIAAASGDEKAEADHASPRRTTASGSDEAASQPKRTRQRRTRSRSAPLGARADIFGARPLGKGGATEDLDPKWRSLVGGFSCSLSTRARGRHHIGGYLSQLLDPNPTHSRELQHKRPFVQHSERPSLSALYVLGRILL
jgi:hypothetical protein